VVAHLTGCLSGILIGLGLGRSRLPEVLGRRAQILLGVTTFALVALAWALAARASLLSG
jgi:hypothetical protein